MAVPARKYNPGFLTDDDLVASFCVRTTEFELLVEVLRECTGSSNPHQIVIGSRGSGKTSLLLRVAAEVRRDAALAAAFFPVVFAEESYEVATTGEFWLECLTHLAAQAPCGEDEPDLHRTVEELRPLRDDRTLADRCLAALLDFADRRDARLLLVVENLNMLFRDMADPDAGWRLRKILQTEPRVVVFASATSRFDEIDHPDRALYDLFRVRTLRPLDTSQCTALWESVSGRLPAPETIRSLEILTGGSPRLIAIVARFGAELSFRDLMADLFDLVDDHTEYFKSHIESLPAQERRVYLALAALWKPATTREIAEQARLDTSTCSAQLARLGERGVVHVAGGSARRKQYYLTERLYNIYYLLRRRRGPDRLVEALIHFMEACYSPSELREIRARMIQDMDSLAARTQALQRVAVDRLIHLPVMVESVDTDAVEADLGLAASIDGCTDRAHDERAARALFMTTVGFNEPAHTVSAVAACNEIVHRFGESESPVVLEWVAKALVNKGDALRNLNRPEGAFAAWDDVVHRFGGSETPVLLESVATALVHKASALGGLKRSDDVLSVCDNVVRRFGESKVPALAEAVATALVNKGVALGDLDREEDALTVYDEAMRRFGAEKTPASRALAARVLVYKGLALANLNRLQEALAAWDEMFRRFETSETLVIRSLVADAMVNKGLALGKLDRLGEGLSACDHVVGRFGDSEEPALVERVAMALVNKGTALGKLNRLEEALAVCDEVVLRFGRSERVSLVERVVRALVNKAVALGELRRPMEGLAVCDDVLRRIGTNESPELRILGGRALLKKAELALGCRRYDVAVSSVDLALDRWGTESPDHRFLGHLIRAKARSRSGDKPGCEQEIEAILSILPEIGPPRKEDLDELIMLSSAIGASRMRELIRTSPAETLLLPLATALDLELGLEPRVAREVEEVAHDIRRGLAELAKQEPTVSSSRKASGEQERRDD